MPLAADAGELPVPAQEDAEELVSTHTGMHVPHDVGLMRDHHLGVCIQNGPKERTAAAGISHQEAEGLDLLKGTSLRDAEHRRTRQQSRLLGL